MDDEDVLALFEVPVACSLEAEVLLMLLVLPSPAPLIPWGVFR